MSIHIPSIYHNLLRSTSGKWSIYRCLTHEKWWPPRQETVISGAFGCGNSWGLLVVVTCRIGKWDHGTHGTWRNPVDIRKTMENHHFLRGKSTINHHFLMGKSWTVPTLTVTTIQTTKKNTSTMDPKCHWEVGLAHFVSLPTHKEVGVFTAWTQ